MRDGWGMKVMKPLWFFLQVFVHLILFYIAVKQTLKFISTGSYLFKVRSKKNKYRRFFKLNDTGLKLIYMDSKKSKSSQKNDQSQGEYMIYLEFEKYVCNFWIFIRKLAVHLIVLSFLDLFSLSMMLMLNCTETLFILNFWLTSFCWFSVSTQIIFL